MKKNLIVIVLTIVSIVSLVYGYSQKIMAERQKIIAEQMANQVVEAQVLCDELREQAEEHAIVLASQLMEAKQALEQEKTK